ncbi:hypothetical protein D9758_013216 [Tetrapyrgos nigripes]|uniref:Uncharacterized protein n=1 Tax=Tetrapyrgos nigripes TaxID=182062 RepID=A0A8H5CRS6_9AGAR|nr:hypothetical protein D9758_013216 [Tetrapyrgos nigripes]
MCTSVYLADILDDFGSVQATSDPSSSGIEDEPFWNALTGKIKNLKALISGHDHGNEWCAREPTKNIIFCFDKHGGYGGYGEPEWGYGVRNLVFTSPKPDALVETWIRLEEGEHLAFFSLFLFTIVHAAPTKDTFTIPVGSADGVHTFSDNGTITSFTALTDIPTDSMKRDANDLSIACFKATFNVNDKATAMQILATTLNANPTIPAKHNIGVTFGKAVTAYDLELRVTSVPRNEDFELIWSRIPAHGDPIPFQLVMVMDAPSRTFSVMTTETLGSTETRTFPAPTETGIYRIVGVRGTDTVTAFPGIDDGSSTGLLVTSPDDEANQSISSGSPGTPTIPPSTTLEFVFLDAQPARSD